MNMHYIGGYASTGWIFKATGHRKIQDGKLHAVSGSTNRRIDNSRNLQPNFDHDWSIRLHLCLWLSRCQRRLSCQDALLLFIVMIYTRVYNVCKYM